MKMWVHTLEVLGVAGLLGAGDYMVQNLATGAPAHGWQAFGVGLGLAAVAGVVNRVRGVQAGIAQGVALGVASQKGSDQ